MGAASAGNLPDLEKSRRTSRETLHEKPKQGIKKIRSAQVRAPLLNLPCLCQWLSLSLESSSVGNMYSVLSGHSHLTCPAAATLRGELLATSTRN